MVKLTSKRKYFFQIRARYESKHRRRFKIWKSNKNRGDQGRNIEQRRDAHYVNRGIKIIAPKIFILRENQEEVLIFIEKLKMIYSGIVFIDLKHVERINNGAVTLLISVLGEYQDKKIRFRGNKPKNIEARKVFEKSGFFDFVNGSIDPDNYNNENIIITKGRNKVKQDVTNRLIKNAMITVYGKEERNTSLQRMLIEMMSNSVQHAYNPKTSNTRWWISFYHHKEENKVSIVYLDNGYGILETLNSNFKNAMIKFVKDESELLQRAFDGKVNSRTKMPGRGRGLPAIYRKSELFHNFTVLSNNAFIDFQKDTRIKLETSYKGTYYYLEVFKK